MFFKDQRQNKFWQQIKGQFFPGRAKASKASQGGQTALKEHVAVLHYETASTTQQPRGEHRGTIKDCKIAGDTTWQRKSNHTFTTILPAKFRVRYDKR